MHFRFRALLLLGFSLFSRSIKKNCSGSNHISIQKFLRICFSSNFVFFPVTSLHRFYSVGIHGHNISQAHTHSSAPLHSSAFIFNTVSKKLFNVKVYEYEATFYPVPWGGLITRVDCNKTITNLKFGSRLFIPSKFQSRQIPNFNVILRKYMWIWIIYRKSWSQIIFTGNPDPGHNPDPDQP